MTDRTPPLGAGTASVFGRQVIVVAGGTGGWISGGRPIGGREPTMGGGGGMLSIGCCCGKYCGGAIEIGWIGADAAGYIVTAETTTLLDPQPVVGE